MLVIGIDENGLGPILGPLVVTGAAFKATSYNRKTFWSLAGPDLPTDDSKALFSRRNPAFGEKAFQSWLGLFKITSDNYATLAKQVCLPLPIPTPCPSKKPACCIPANLTLPLWSTSQSGGLSLGIWNRFDKAKIQPYRAASFAACPGALNRTLGAQNDTNKFKLDFELMMQMIDSLKEKTDEQVVALCGKVGSTKNYGPWLCSFFGSKSYTVVTETREISTYKIENNIEISFIRDGDSIHLPIAVASMIGKYIRELSMFQLNRDLQNPSKREASGYRDKITAKFIEETKAIRSKIGLIDSCFTRNS